MDFLCIQIYDNSTSSETFSISCLMSCKKILCLFLISCIFSVHGKAKKGQCSACFNYAREWKLSNNSCMSTTQHKIFYKNIQNLYKTYALKGSKNTKYYFL